MHAASEQLQRQPSEVVLLCCSQIRILHSAGGRGEDGQLGHGDAEERKEPQAIYGLLNSGVTSVHSGAEYSLACCRNRREVFSWGW